MDTKLKNSRKRGIIAAVILLGICSMIMMSQYDGIGRAIKSVPTTYEASFVDTLGESSFGQDLAEGNYLVYNQYSRDTDPAEVLKEFGQRNFELTGKYLDIGLFDAEGNPLSVENDDSESKKAAPLETGDNAETEEGNTQEAGKTGDTEETGDTADTGNTTDTESTADRRLAEADESEAGYAFRAKYTFSAGGELAGIQVDGTELEPEDEYTLETRFLAYAQQTEDEQYISSITSPQDVTIIYGMSEENKDAFMEKNAWIEENYPPEVEYTANYRDTLETLWVIVILAALLLPFRKKLDISDMKLFDVPFEVVLLVWLLAMTASLDGPAPYIVDHTVRDTLLPGMQMGNGIWLIAMAFNFAMWFVLIGVFFWAATSLRAIFRMKGAYWRDRTLTMKLIRHYRGRGTESDEEMVRKAGGVIKRVKGFFAKQYDALQHLDFREKTNRTILKIVIINYIILAVVCFLWYYGTLALIIYSVLLFLFLRKYVKDLQEKYKLLLRSTNQLANGHLDVPIEGDIGLFNPIQDELKKIQKGFKKAVDEEVKNERMKTELVTNVSHDLRTPLTAIITYTDLLKNEKDEEKRKEYIEVLEKKSLRLKVLIEDLFEISKAASKSVVMHYMKVDIVDLIKQVGLENDSKIKEANLDFRWKLPEHKLVMWLDSQKTYRIFENLIVNITKYAMPHTRVYIEMSERKNDVHISMKNISAAELNFDTEEITDRFVRGDVSRNTEGSGLGLAIAKSFIELQHGTLKISTEADLFKADITLPKLEIPPEEEQRQQAEEEQRRQEQEEHRQRQEEHRRQEQKEHRQQTEK